jgi:hypothetical protein
VTETVDKSLQKMGVTLSKPALAVIFLVFGVLIIIYKDLVAYLIAVFLLIQGILILVEYYETTHKTYILQTLPKPEKNAPPPPPTPSAAPVYRPAPPTPPTPAAEPEPEEETAETAEKPKRQKSE